MIISYILTFQYGFTAFMFYVIEKYTILRAEVMKNSSPVLKKSYSNCVLHKGNFVIFSHL